MDTVHQKFQSNAKDASTQTQLSVEDASTQTRKCMCICYSIYAGINTGLIFFIEGGNCSVGAGVGCFPGKYRIYDLCDFLVISMAYTQNLYHTLQ